MTANRSTKMSKWKTNIRSFFDKHDIFFFTYAPPAIALGIVIICALIGIAFPEVEVPLPLVYIGLSLLMFFQCLTGSAQVYKREMPGPMGRTIKGKVAVVSGALLIVFSAFLGFGLLIYAISLI